MQWIGFSETAGIQSAKIAILAYDLDYPGMLKNYVEEGLIKCGADKSIVDEIIAVKLPFTVSGAKRKRKALPVGDRREFFDELLPLLKEAGVEHIVVANPDYFKTLTGLAKAALEVGTLSPPCETHFESFNDMRVGFVPNFKMAFYDPDKTRSGIETTMSAIVKKRAGSYVAPGQDIIKFCYYPSTMKEIWQTLEFLAHYDGELTADIEGFSLDMHDAGIGSISFAWNENYGVAFQVDYAPGFVNYGVREALVQFFRTRYEHSRQNGRTAGFIWHNAGYDVPVLIHQLHAHHGGTINQWGDWDYEDFFDWLTGDGMIQDTKIISYLATNSCAGNKLGLKEQAVEFAGNYAVEDIKDITKIPLRELLEYNLVDALSTWYVYNKNYPKMCEDNQERVYWDIFLPALVDVIDMQLNGLPVDMEQVAKSKAELKALNDGAMQTIQDLQIVKEYTYHLKELEVEKLHAKWKKKRTTAEEIDLTFNPNSDSQLAGLLYSDQFCGFPVLGKTDSGQPSTKGVYVKALKNHTTDPDMLALIDAIVELKDTGILLSTFIPAFENARRAPDGWYYVHGNFNLGGTVSGRLSSSDPNLQNIPSGSRLAKYLKLCVKAPPGFLFMGLDFDSLEDKISALVTKDPNKLKVYTDGYDGHSLRAFSYFGDKMPDIDGSSVESINSIADKYKKVRQASKAPTFLLTYGGTYHGLMSNCGFSEKEALAIEKNYHELYKVSDDYVAAQIQGARDNGYITVAFGLRVRTPILGQTVDTERHTPYAAKAEGRTAGNAIGQSWGLLNNRAASAFMSKVRKSEKRADIRICCQIHDAQYYLVRAKPHIIHWFNQNLVEAVQWQDHPKIEHDLVKLSGEVSIFYPTWATEYVIPNDATIHDIKDLGVKIYEEQHS